MTCQPQTPTPLHSQEMQFWIPWKKKKKNLLSQPERNHISCIAYPARCNIECAVHLSNQPTKCTNSCFIIRLLYAYTCFEHYVLIIRRSKFYYTAYGIITHVGGRPVHRLRADWSALNLCTGRPPTGAMLQYAV